MTLTARHYRLIIPVFVTLKVLIPLFAILSGGYGIFRDELYYLACAEHPATGYVDHPPLSIWILNAYTSVFGDHWQAIRIVPAVFGGLTMYVLMQWVRQLGGANIALITAGMAFLFAPINIGMTSVYSMNSIDIFFWALCFYTGTRTLQQPERRILWAILGLAVGLGMLNKISISWYAIGLIVYLIFSPDRKLLRTARPHIAGILAFVIFLPFVIWNIQHDMAHLTFASNASNFKYANISRSDFLFGMVMLEHPLSLVLLIFSGICLFRSDQSAANKSSLVIFIVTLLILLIKGQVKSEYMAGAFTAVFALGALQLETSWNGKAKAIAVTFLALYGFTGLALIPLASPILSEKDFINYQSELGIGQPNNEGKEESSLPQFFADMHGWKSLAEDVSSVYQQLPDSSHASAVVWAGNYGEAGAIDYYRKDLPLPEVLSPHNNYYFWSLEKTQNESYDTYIILGGSADDHRKFLKNVRRAAVFTCEYCMPYENNMGIFIGTDPMPGLTIRDILQNERNFN